MKIAIQVADLDCQRIDGTRVFLWNTLKYLGKIFPQDQFCLYHKTNFNPALKPVFFSNYLVKKLTPFPFWTQTRLAKRLFQDKPQVLWMPMHNIPLFHPSSTKVAVTIHDLAFKYFPQMFPRKERLKINWLSDQAIQRSDKIMAVSQATKEDILKFYPQIPREKIKVIYHGLDKNLFQKENDLDKHQSNYRYILYVGALQPRKNIQNIVKAFEIYKQKTKSKIKLVIAGSKAWLWEEILEAMRVSAYSADIVFKEKPSFQEIKTLYSSASLFLFPSLYEGFGLPVLEAQAMGTPVITSNLSSLPEIVDQDYVLRYYERNNVRNNVKEKKEKNKNNSSLYLNQLKKNPHQSALLVDPYQPQAIAQAIETILENQEIKEILVQRGKTNLQRFSWEKTAREIGEVLKGMVGE